jgi:hypothetical protein
LADWIAVWVSSLISDRGVPDVLKKFLRDHSQFLPD